jgi:protein Mpv17
LFIEKNKDFSKERVIKMTLVGTCYAAPLLHTWYTFGVPKVHKFVALFYPKAAQFGSTKKLLLSVFIDQTFFAAFFTSGFFLVMDRMAGETIEKSLNNIRHKMWPTLVANWKIWPATSLINFSIVPIDYRVLVANFVGLFWNCYLSYMQHFKV